MALHTLIINHNASYQRNLWLTAVGIGILLGLGCGIVGLLFLRGPGIQSTDRIIFVVTYLVLGLIAGVVIGWFGREVLRGMIALVSRELTSKVGLKTDNFRTNKTGLAKEFDIFDQMFKVVMSVLKRVLIISLKLESASADLDDTAQTSSCVIKDIVSGVEAVNKKAGDNASNLKETITSLENSFTLSKDISSKLTVAKEDSQAVSEIAGGTQTSVKEAVKKMLKIKELTDGSAKLVNDLNDRSKQIGMILTEIANIAEKTNLLALNAAIEAARAGEQGLGFAVVAEEVRKLARGSAESSKKINNLINDILQKTENAAEMMMNNTIQVNEGMQVVTTVESSLGSMVKTTSQLNSIIKDISGSAVSQSATSDVMYKKVNRISEITDEISMQIKNIATSALGRTVIIDQTSSSAKELRTLSDVFQNALVPFDFHIEGATKRAAIRTETRVPCKFRMLISGETADESSYVSSDYNLRGTITNLSAGGCVIETSEDVEQGSYIILAFQLGSNFIQGLQGRLVRQRVKMGQDDSVHSSDTSVMTPDDFGMTLPNKNMTPVNECVVSFSNVSKDHETVIIDFVISAQKQFETNLGLME